MINTAIGDSHLLVCRPLFVLEPSLAVRREPLVPCASAPPSQPVIPGQEVYTELVYFNTCGPLYTNWMKKNVYIHNTYIHFVSTRLGVIN